MLNDILDSLDMSANVSSVACVVREGKERCIAYLQGKQGEWEKYGVYENCCLQTAPETSFPSGTPGIPAWKLSSVS